MKPWLLYKSSIAVKYLTLMRTSVHNRPTQANSGNNWNSVHFCCCCFFSHFFFAKMPLFIASRTNPELSINWFALHIYFSAEVWHLWCSRSVTSVKYQKCDSCEVADVLLSVSTTQGRTNVCNNSRPAIRTPK